MSVQSARQFALSGPRRLPRTRQRSDVPQHVLEYYREQNRRRRGTVLRVPEYPFVDAHLASARATTLATSVLCEGARHEIRARPGGALQFMHHTRGELRALKVLAEMGAKPCGCLAFARGIVRSKQRKTFQPVLDAARAAAIARADARTLFDANLMMRRPLHPQERYAMLRAKWHRRAESITNRLRYRIGERYGWDVTSRHVAMHGRGPNVVVNEHGRHIELQFDWPWLRLELAGVAMLGEEVVLSFARSVDRKLARASVMELVFESREMPTRLEVVKDLMQADDIVKATRTKRADVLVGARIAERTYAWKSADRFSPAGWQRLT